MDVLSPSASPAVEVPQEEVPQEEVPQEEVLQEEEAADLQEDTPQEEEAADLQEEEAADLQEETDLQEEDPTQEETTPTRNQMSAASFPRPTSMYPTSHSPSMRRSLENTLRIIKSTN